MSDLGLADLNGRLYLEWTKKLSRPGDYVRRSESDPFPFQNGRYRLMFEQSFGRTSLSLKRVEGPRATETIVVTALMVEPGIYETKCQILTREKVLEMSGEITLRAIHSFRIPADSRCEESVVRFVLILEQDRTAPLNGKADTLTQTECAEGTSDFPSDLDSLSLDFANLLKNGTLPDVKLKCGGRDGAIPAHRSVLAARSEVFAAMFRNEMAESQTGEVNVDDMDDDVINPFLQYVYTGKIPSGVTEEVLPGLYAAADKYAVHALRKTCRSRMVDLLTEENCVNFLTLADAHGNADFKKSVIDYICSHKAVFKGDAWREFVKQPSLLAMEVYQSNIERET